ncbi:hypothetical protein [Helicobacter heilmannii]|uniref:hypothetical protein n=1 Tax=Helicobacter heilmannii TaxID=35817 RepID=UPI0006A17ED5|nr:hypothetical protein [Helicobacter heilmannii]CRF45819.1 hypothetical protein HHE014_07960 [Helicobacter heilmannii]
MLKPVSVMIHFDKHGCFTVLKQQGGSPLVHAKLSNFIESFDNEPYLCKSAEEVIEIFLLN